MNDRAVNVLEQYDLAVERTWKGRGSILFETKNGIYILKEYKGTPQRISQIAKSLQEIQQNGYEEIETILPNKEGEFFCADYDRTIYIVKSYVQAKECSIRDKEEYLKGIKNLARLHKAMEGVGRDLLSEPSKLPILREIEKHNAELKGVRRYIRNKGQKSEFELYLQKHYDFFFEQAVSVQEKLLKENISSWLLQIREKHTVCHGDYQYHNILMTDNSCFIINFEKIAVDSPVRDLYLFMRKLLEKNNWNIDLGKELLHIYNEERALQEEELLQLKYRFYYPEKFWKIVNFYYNSPKTWISSKNGEKLTKLLEQEEAKKTLMQTMFSM